MKLLSDYKDQFVEKHGVKLGLMSCFVKVMFTPFFLLLNIMIHISLACSRKKTQSYEILKP